LGRLGFSGSWDGCLNCPVSSRIISSFDLKCCSSKLIWIEMISAQFYEFGKLCIGDYVDIILVHFDQQLMCSLW